IWLLASNKEDPPPMLGGSPSSRDRSWVGRTRDTTTTKRSRGRINALLNRRHTETIMSKPSKEFINPKTLIAPGPAMYSHVAKVNRGTIVYISGQVPSDASGKIIGEGDFEVQVEQV